MDVDEIMGDNYDFFRRANGLQGPQNEGDIKIYKELKKKLRDVTIDNPENESQRAEFKEKFASKFNELMNGFKIPGDVDKDVNATNISNYSGDRSIFFIENTENCHGLNGSIMTPILWEEILSKDFVKNAEEEIKGQEERNKYN